MSNHQFHYGKKFYQDKKTGYWISTQCPKIRAHVWVWKYHHNLVPKGWHVHHKDMNKSNNAIENLTIMSNSDHSRHHMELDPERKKKAAENCDRIRPMTKAWHKSDEGKMWHKIHALKMKFGNGEYFDYICEECKKPYKSKLKALNRTRFCSNNCKSQWRRNQKIDDVIKICPVCNKEYSSNKYSRSKTCGRTCGKKLIML